MHQSQRRKLQQITVTHHLQLELSGPMGCSEELCLGRSSGAPVAAAQLHHAGSAVLTRHVWCTGQGSGCANEPRGC